MILFPLVDSTDNFIWEFLPKNIPILMGSLLLFLIVYRKYFYQTIKTLVVLLLICTTIIIFALYKLGPIDNFDGYELGALGIGAFALAGFCGMILALVFIGEFIYFCGHFPGITLTEKQKWVLGLAIFGGIYFCGSLIIYYFSF